MDKQKLKNSFDDIFASVESIPDRIETKNTDSIIEKPQQTMMVNYDQRKDKLYTKAKKTIDSLLKFYLNEEIIDEEQYIYQKSLQDKETLSGLMFQIDVSMKAVTTLINSIDMGDVSPRMFEVLSDAQRTFIELLKMKSQHLIMSEESMKRLIHDKEMYGVKVLTPENKKDEGGLSTRGTKNLLKNLRSIIDTKEIEEGDVE